MNALTRCLSTAEISQRILDMAVTGVYRESVIEAFYPLATKKQIRQAIAQAKQLGVRSVPQLRDETLGTYYQIDASSYASAQAVVKAEIARGAEASPAERLLLATQALRAMLGVSVTFALLLGVCSTLLWLNGQLLWGTGTLLGSLSAAGIWLIQKRLARNLI